jgi:hypothetical protein
MDNVMRVSNLCESKSESVSVHVASSRQSVPLSVGQEAIISKKTKDISSFVAVDNLGRRRSKSIESLTCHKILKSEVSLPSAMQQHGLINEIMVSSNKAHSKLRSKLAKMAACLMVVTNSHGNYAQGEGVFGEAN